MLWFSRKDDWGHLYLHDAGTGLQKNRITDGRRQCHAGAARRRRRRGRSTSRASARRKGRDPYFRHFYKIGFDGKGQTLLTPEDGDHAVDLSPSGSYFVDTYSKPDVPPVSVLRDVDRQGRRARSRRADISQLVGRRMEAADAVHA